MHTFANKFESQEKKREEAKQKKVAENVNLKGEKKDK